MQNCIWTAGALTMHSVEFLIRKSAAAQPVFCMQFITALYHCTACNNINVLHYAAFYALCTATFTVLKCTELHCMHFTALLGCIYCTALHCTALYSSLLLAVGEFYQTRVKIVAALQTISWYIDSFISPEGFRNIIGTRGSMVVLPDWANWLNRQDINFSLGKQHPEAVPCSRSIQQRGGSGMSRQDIHVCL